MACWRRAYTSVYHNTGRYLLFKSQSKWTDSQKKRAIVSFREFPKIKKAYVLSMMFRSVYEHNHSIKEAKKN